jgi:hypothetical protein
MNPINEESGRSRESLEAENARLRARIRELESRYSDRRANEYDEPWRRRRREETEDRVRDIPSHTADSLERLTRGLTYAFVEQLQSGVDALNVVADEILGPSRSTRRTRYEGEERGEYRRRRTSRYEETEADEEYDEERGRRPGRRSADMMSDVAAGIAEVIHESLDTPRRVVERFFDAYYEENEPRRRREEEPRDRRWEARRERGGRVQTELTETETVSPTGTRTTSETEIERES